MTLPALLAHLAARWAVTRTPAHGWVPDEREIEMSERTYTLADMARAWDAGYRGGWCDHGTGVADYIAGTTPNPYEQEEA